MANEQTNNVAIDETTATEDTNTIKLKESLSKANSEASKYKKELTTRNTEYDELSNRYSELETRVRNFELKEKCLDAGFSKEETAKLIDSNMSPETIAEILKARMDEYVNSQNANKIMGTPKISMSTKANAGNETDSIGKRLAEQKFKK